MDQKQIAAKIIEFNKTTFDSAFSAMVVLQDQNEKLVSGFLEKAPWFPEQGKKAVTDWVNNRKKGREDFKAAADENYKKVTDTFFVFQKEETDKTAKNSSK